jgi:Ca-activated chloride channel family protein
MKRALIVGILSMAAVIRVGAEQGTFRSRVDLVHFGVVVTDKQGAPITGLKADDFEVVEEGKKQTVRFFSAGETALAPPLHLGLLLDVSGSMEDDIKDVRTAVVKFLNAMADAVDTTLVDFDTEVRVARYGPNDVPRLIERIRMRKPDGWTALYDAIGVYLNGAADQEGQKILVLYTDGGDTRSSATLSDTLNLIRASDVTVYAIGYLEHQSSSARVQQRMELQRFAAETGGQALFPSSIKELDKIYERIRREIAARYSLGYSSSDERANGNWRKVDIRLTRPDLKGAKLRTRTGYFAPYRPGSR